MTTSTAPTHRAPAPDDRSRGGSPLTGTLAITRHILRRDRVRMSVWVLSMAAFIAYFSVALSSIFDDSALAARAEVMRTPSGIVMGGPGYGLDDYAPMVAVANEGTTWTVLALSIMAILHVVRHTRAEEESARAELVRASAVGPLAPVAAALLTLVLHLMVIAAIGALASLAGEDPSLVDGLGMMGGSALSALVFGAVALVTCQITASARGATGLGLAVFAVAFVIRAAGDMIELKGSALSWFSPVAWAQQMRAFVDLRWWPALLSIAATAVLLFLAASLARRRDFGQGLTADRAGRAHALASLSTPIAMAWRQQRATLLWCGLGMALMWFATGTMLSTMNDLASELVADNPALGALFGTDPAAFTESFLAVMLLFVALCVVAVAIVTTHQYCRSEEIAGRLEIVLAGPVSRWRWLGAQLLVSGIGAAALFALSVVAMWIGAILVGVDEPELPAYLAAFASHAPPIVLFAALSAALYAWVPRAAGLTWLLLAFVLVAQMFGTIFDFPDALLGISPFHWVSEPFVEDFEAGGALGVTAVVAILYLLALVGFRRREVQSGS
ncbi:ABC transporter permease [Brachybacterium sp. GCM10030267]|uniref:ABC transporter permease n=1 Tax=Brachybacterium sp. GCM10030267 TaxID=3273381 RepID=UPI00361D58EE